MSINIDLHPQYHPEKKSPKWEVYTGNDGKTEHIHTDKEVVDHVSDWMKKRERKGHK